MFLEIRVNKKPQEYHQKNKKENAFFFKKEEKLRIKKKNYGFKTRKFSLHFDKLDILEKT